jgi:hypothetical protein
VLQHGVVEIEDETISPVITANKTHALPVVNAYNGKGEIIGVDSINGSCDSPSEKASKTRKRRLITRYSSSGLGDWKIGYNPVTSEDALVFRDHSSKKLPNFPSPPPRWSDIIGTNRFCCLNAHKQTLYQV